MKTRKRSGLSDSVREWKEVLVGVTGRREGKGKRKCKETVIEVKAFDSCKTKSAD